MEAILIVWLAYESTFLRVAHTAVTVEQFATMRQCEKAAGLLLKNMKGKYKFDETVIKCESLE